MNDAASAAVNADSAARAPADSQPARGEREAFEAWIKKDCGDLSTFGSGVHKHYRNSAVNNAWQGWKARAARAPTDSVTAPAGGAAAGIEAAAKLLERKADDFASENAIDDLGGLSFGRGAHADAKLEYHSTLLELAEEIRSLAAAPTQAADSVLEDAERWQTFIALPYATRAEWASNLSLAPVLTQWVDAARKKGANHD